MRSNMDKFVIDPAEFNWIQDMRSLKKSDSGKDEKDERSKETQTPSDETVSS